MSVLSIFFQTIASYPDRVPTFEPVSIGLPARTAISAARVISATLFCEILSSRVNTFFPGVATFLARVATLEPGVVNSAAH
jgi:hypothetical protein